MLRKLGKRLINNFGLKILAALFAVVLWIVVVNIDDPTITRTYTTSITLENRDYLTSLNKYFEIIDGNNTISFRVSAKRTVQERLSGSDFTATADLKKTSMDPESGVYRVPITITQTKFSSGSVVITPSKQNYLAVNVEDLGEVQKAIIARTKGSVADGCALGKVHINTLNVLKISGPSSVVSQIDTAAATINVDGMSTDVTDNVVPMLYDKNGNVIDTTKLTLSVSTVTVTAQILNTKDVELEFHTSGSVENGYKVTGIEYKPETVRIKGEAAVLNPVTKISIPDEVLDLTGAVKDIETTVDISSYLPEGTSMVLNSDAKVNIVIRIEPIITQSFDVPVSNLTVENLREGYTAEFEYTAVTVEISGAESAIEELDAQQLTGTMDASGLGKGAHTLKVEFPLDEERYQVTAPVRAAVSIVEQSNDNNPGNQDHGNQEDQDIPQDTETGKKPENEGDKNQEKPDDSKDQEPSKDSGKKPSKGEQNVNESTEI